jgi:hypothetical protein
LRDVKFSDAYQVPFYKGSPKTQALGLKDFEGFVALKIFNLEYLNEVTEAT